MIGYEARARVTTDVSGFVAGQRAAAQAAGALATAVQTLNTQLMRTQNLSAMAAAGMSNINRAASNVSQTQRGAATSAQALNQAMNAGAQAYAASASGAAQASAAMANNASNTQASTQATQRNVQAQKQSTQTLASMGQQMERLSQQRRILIEQQRNQGRLNNAEQQALTTLRERLRELGQRYSQLTNDQRQVVDSSRNMAAAQNTVRSSTATMSREIRESARAMSEQERAAGDLNRSTWSMRSAVGDLTSSMSQLWSVSRRVTSALWDNYSAQEMAIAQISRVSQATVSELDTIVQQVRTMSTEIPIAFEELGEIAMLGSQVGIANEALGTFTETVALFAATSEVSADETATMLARIMEMTNLSRDYGQDAVRNLGSAIAYLGSNALATDREILKTVESIATMTTQVGFSAEATVGLGSAMASLVIRPEIARGASQRVFLQLGEAVQGTGAEMETLVGLTNSSQDALQELADSDFESFFLTVMESLAGVAQEGGDLIPIIRELGIINTRDAEVVARLAANYDILEGSIREAGTAFEDGTYLYEESDRIFNNLTATVQLMANTWSNFLFAAVEAIAPFLTRVVEATTNIIQMAEAMGAAPFLGWGAAILGLAGAVGLLASGIGFAAQGFLSFIGIMRLLSGRVAVTSAAMGTAAAANTAVGTTATVAAGAATAQSVGMTAAAGAATRFSASMAIATGAVRAFALANPVTALITVGAAILGAAAAWDAFGDSTARAERRLLAANRVHIDAAGGMKALQDALIEDTQRWNEAQDAAYEHFEVLANGRQVMSEAGQEILEYAAFRTFSVREMVDADREAADSAYELEQAQNNATRGIESHTGALGGATDSLRDFTYATHPALGQAEELEYAQWELARAARDTNEAFDGTVVAIGAATRDFGAAVVNSALLETSMWESAGALKAVEDAGISMSDALTLELSNAGDGALYLEQGVQRIGDSMSDMEREMTGNAIWINKLTFGFIDLRTESQIAVDDLRTMGDTFDALTLAIESTEYSNAQLVPVLDELADELGYTTDELGDMDDAAIDAAASTEILEESVMGIGITVSEFAEGMASFIDPLGQWSDALQEINDGLEEGEEAYERFIDKTQDRNDFNEYLAGMYDMREAQMEWSANLLELSESVPPQVIGDLAAMGEEGAGLVADLVDATDEQVQHWVRLWEQGGDDLLNDYATIWEVFRANAADGGDEGGMAFVEDLMAQMNRGDIEMSDVVDQMVEYAEENFDQADPTMNFYADNTRAIDELSNTMRMVRDSINDLNTSGDLDLEPDVESSSLWSKLSSLWDSIVNWWGSGPNMSVSPQVSGNYGGSGTFGPLPRKDGGWISGPGGPRQDKVPVLASPNEFMVAAEPAARFAPLLEWINNNGQGPSRRDFVPQMQLGDSVRATPPSSASNVRNRPDFAQVASAGVSRAYSSERVVFNINNHYPQAEPTSVTTNRALQYAAGLNGVL